MSKLPKMPYNSGIGKLTQVQFGGLRHHINCGDGECFDMQNLTAENYPLVSVRKKRGNLYLNDLRYFCFNCGYSTGINKLLHDFGEDLSLQDKYKVREIQQNATKFEKKTHSGHLCSLLHK